MHFVYKQSHDQGRQQLTTKREEGETMLRIHHLREFFDFLSLPHRLAIMIHDTFVV